MRTPLWSPSAEVRRRANLTRFMALVNQKHDLALTTYPQLYDWSVQHIPAFWADMWSFAGLEAVRGYDEVVDSLDRFPGRAGLKAPG